MGTHIINDTLCLVIEITALVNAKKASTVATSDAILVLQCVSTKSFSTVYLKTLCAMYALHFVFKITRTHEQDFYFYCVTNNVTTCAT